MDSCQVLYLTNLIFGYDKCLSLSNFHTIWFNAYIMQRFYYIVLIDIMGIIVTLICKTTRNPPPQIVVSTYVPVRYTNTL